VNLDVRRPVVVVVLLALFCITRVALVWLTDNPEVYGDVDPTSDVTIYQNWGNAVHLDGASPYADVRIEYPPGAIPFLVAPSAVGDGGDNYRPLFAALMAGVDLVGFGALYLMVRRGGSPWALIGWLLVPPLLGPVLYARFDLVPAVAMILALERAQAHKWFGVGGWLGFGAMAKLIPGLLAPLAFIVSPRRRTVVLGFAVVTALMLLPYIGVPRGLVDSVFGYHGDRGVQVESLWGSLVLLGDHLGYDSGVAFQFGAMDVYGPAVNTFKSLSNVLALAGVLFGCFAAWRWARRDSAPDLALAMFGTLALTTAVGRVYSPQYTVWLLGVGAAALALNGRRVRWPFGALVAVVALTAWIFPPLFSPILGNELWAVLVLLTRNLLTLAVGVLAFLALWRERLVPDAVTGGRRDEAAATEATVVASIS
jgi:hypothetical protein